MTYSLNVSGMPRRTYRLYWPPSLKREQPVPLVIALHGGGSDGLGMERLTGFGVHIPGLGKAEARMHAARDGVAIPAAIHARIAGWANRPS